MCRIQSRRSQHRGRSTHTVIVRCRRYRRRHNIRQYLNRNRRLRTHTVRTILLSYLIGKRTHRRGRWTQWSRNLRRSVRIIPHQRMTTRGRRS